MNKQQFDWAHELPIDGTLDLLKGVYNRIYKDYKLPSTGFPVINICRCSGRFWIGNFLHFGDGHHLAHL